jgi:hypothetical protein
LPPGAVGTVSTVSGLSLCMGSASRRTHRCTMGPRLHPEAIGVDRRRLRSREAACMRPAMAAVLGSSCLPLHEVRTWSKSPRAWVHEQAYMRLRPHGL